MRVVRSGGSASVGGGGGGGERWTALHLKGKHDAAFAEYERRRNLSDDLSQLAGVKNDTKNFMAFLFHEIRAPLSVVSLGAPCFGIKSRRRGATRTRRSETSESSRRRRRI